jgi:hypothetical protein
LEYLKCQQKCQQKIEKALRVEQILLEPLLHLPFDLANGPAASPKAAQ